jgi:hypothetical protein
MSPAGAEREASVSIDIVVQLSLNRTGVHRQPEFLVKQLELDLKSFSEGFCSLDITLQGTLEELRERLQRWPHKTEGTSKSHRIRIRIFLRTCLKTKWIF